MKHLKIENVPLFDLYKGNLSVVKKPIFSPPNLIKYQLSKLIKDKEQLSCINLEINHLLNNNRFTNIKYFALLTMFEVSTRTNNVNTAILRLSKINLPKIGEVFFQNGLNNCLRIYPESSKFLLSITTNN